MHIACATRRLTKYASHDCCAMTFSLAACACPLVCLSVSLAWVTLNCLMHLMQDAGQGHLIEMLPKNIGFGMGLEFREAINLLNNKNDRKVAAGMVFNVAVGTLSSPVFCLVCAHAGSNLSAHPTMTA